MEIVLINPKFLSKNFSGSLTFYIIIALTSKKYHGYNSCNDNSQNSCKHFIPKFFPGEQP